MKTAISKGVVTVSVDASSTEFNYYSSGIFDQATACGTKLDHAIAAIGYGTDSSGTSYYIIRNSWSADWGEEGYIRFEMTGDGDGMCGVQMAAFTANAELVPNLSAI
jgi:KDEL-tailed cysteine endopeptidase